MPNLPEADWVKQLNKYLFIFNAQITMTGFIRSKGGQDKWDTPFWPKTTLRYAFFIFIFIDILFYWFSACLGLRRSTSDVFNALCVRVWQIYHRPSVPSHRTSSFVDVFHFNLKKIITNPAWTKRAMLNSAHGTCILIVFMCVRVDVCSYVEQCSAQTKPHGTNSFTWFVVLLNDCKRLLGSNGHEALI